MNAPAPDKPDEEAVLSDYTTATASTPTPAEHDLIERLEAAAHERSFAIADPAKRAYVLHGYLLALEDIVAAGSTAPHALPANINDHLTSSLARLLKREHGIPFATRAARVDGWAT
jgi:hypothetical protein